MILFMIQFFIYVILSLRLVVYAYMCAILLIIDSLRYSWKRFHSSWVSTGHRHVPVFRILGSGAWHHCSSTGCITPLGLCVTESLRVIRTSSQYSRNIIRTPAQFLPWWEKWDLLCMRCSKFQGYPWETCHTRSTFLVLKNCIYWKKMLLKCMRPTGRSFVIFTFVLRQPIEVWESQADVIG